MLETLADLPFASAVYAIENVVNGKIYIVSTLNARRRGATISRQGRRSNRYLQHAFDKPLFVSITSKFCGPGFPRRRGAPPLLPEGVSSLLCTPGDISILRRHRMFARSQRRYKM